MSATVEVRWYPQRLNAAIVTGTQLSFGEALAFAEAAAPSHRAGVVLKPLGETSAALVPTDLGTVFERGRRGGYAIQPIKRQALKIGSGFAAYATGGPMSPEPYIGPAAQQWARGGAQATMRKTCAAAGYR